jgi:class 3 adenylate cyclase/tetratricopeptide (TPR) repeat protein
VACGFAIGADDKFCGGCGQPIADKALASRAALEGERKQVTILVADVTGSMELLAGRDPEEARKILDPIVGLMMDAVHRYEGTVNQVMGDGIMALFGAPTAHEDHAVRACYAAVDIQNAARRYAERPIAGGRSPLVRVGLNSGEVVVRAIGSDLHMDYSAIGRTTHLAARMEQVAEPGTILATAHVMRSAGEYVTSRPLGRTPVRGLPEPVEIFEITGTAGTRVRFDSSLARGLSPFVGRDSVVRSLVDALTRAGRGGGELVALVGEPGVGKSRVVWELLHHHVPPEWRILQARSTSFGKATPYLPVIGLLRRSFDLDDHAAAAHIAGAVADGVAALDGALAADVPALLAVMGAAGDDARWRALDPAQQRERIRSAVKRLVVELARRQPLALVFEDLQWIDQDTQDILDVLVDTLPSAHVLMLVDYRPEYRHGWTGRPRYTELRLEPLPADTAASLVDGFLGRRGSVAGVRQSVLARTQGNPLFIEEMVRHFVENGALVGDRGDYECRREPDGLDVPDTVHAVLAARIDRLDADDKRVLQAAAVVGKRIPLPVLEDIGVVTGTVLRDAMARLTRTEFLHEESRFPEIEYAFNHALAHDVAYAGLLHDRRKHLHAAALAAMERLHAGRLSGHAEALAEHAIHGEVWDRAVDHLLEASSQAFVQGALARSLDAAERALELCGRLPEGAPNAARAIDVRLAMYAPLLMRGDLGRIILLIEQAEALARGSGDRLRLGRALSRLASPRWARGEFDAALELAQAAHAIGREIGDVESRLSGTVMMGLIHFSRGEYRAAVDALKTIPDGPDAEAAKERSSGSVAPFMVAVSWLMLSLSSIGDFDETLRYADLALAAVADGAPTAQVAVHTCHAVALGGRGDFAAARAAIDESRRIAEANAVMGWLPTVYAIWGWLAAETGEPDEGVACIERSLGVQEGIGLKSQLPMAYLRLAEARLAAGQYETAVTDARRARDVAESVGDAGVRARALGALALATVETGADGAEALYRDVERAARDLDMRPLEAHAHLGLARVFHRAGRTAEVSDHLATALAMYRDMGMTHWVKKAESLGR